MLQSPIRRFPICCVTCENTADDQEAYELKQPPGRAGNLRFGHVVAIFGCEQGLEATSRNEARAVGIDF